MIKVTNNQKDSFFYKGLFNRSYQKLTLIKMFATNFFNKHTLLIGIGFVIFLWLPFLILGEHTYLSTKDNLEIEVIYQKISSDNLFVFPWQIVNQVLGGISRCFLRSGLHISIFFYYLFPPFVAYSINELLIKGIAFLGMFLLCRKYIGSSNLISFISATLFAMLPFLHSFGFGIAGLPLVFYSFFNTLKRQSKFTDYLFLVAFPFCSLAVYTGFWLLPLFFLILLFDFYKTGKFSRSAFLMILLMGVLYLLVEYNLIYQLYQSIVVGNQDYVTHRVEGMPKTSLTIKCFLECLLNGDCLIEHKTTALFHPLFFLFCLFLTLLFYFKEKVTKTDFKQSWICLKKTPIVDLIFCTFLLIVLFFVIPLILNFFHLGNKILSLKRVFQIFIFFWYIFFAFFLGFISKQIKTIFILFIVLVQFCYIFANNIELRKNFIESYRYLFSKCQSVEEELVYYKNVEHMSFKSYYSKILYSKISDFIGQDKKTYKIVSIGIDPMISLFNGFCSLDGYFNNYPLGYRRKFLKVVKDENYSVGFIKLFITSRHIMTLNNIEKCALGYKSFFKETERFKIMDKEKFNSIDLTIDLKVLKDLGCDYILSSKKFANLKDISLKFLNTFTDIESPWTIHLYSIA